MQDNFTKIQTEFLEMKNITSEIKNTLERIIAD